MSSSAAQAACLLPFPWLRRTAVLHLAVKLTFATKTDYESERQLVHTLAHAILFIELIVDRWFFQALELRGRIMPLSSGTARLIKARTVYIHGLTESQGETIKHFVLRRGFC